MPVNKLFGGNIEIMQKALSLRHERQGLIQSNVANYETPGYTEQDFNFAKAMRSAMTGQGQLARTDLKHLAPVPAESVMDFASDKKPVDLDMEMVKLAENQLMFQTIAKVIGKKFEGLRYAIEEGGK